MDQHAHWDNVYSSKAQDAVSWFTPNPTLSMQLIRQVSPGTQGRIIDVGGGASLLVDKLMDEGFRSVAVLDISEAALNRSKQRLGERAGSVRWMVADVTSMEDAGQFDVWHDRAVFSFLDRTEGPRALRSGCQENCTDWASSHYFHVRNRRPAELQRTERLPVQCSIPGGSPWR